MKRRSVCTGMLTIAGRCPGVCWWYSLNSSHMFRDGCSALPFIYSHASVDGGLTCSESALLYHPGWRLTCCCTCTIPRGIESMSVQTGAGGMEIKMIYLLFSKLYQRRKSFSCKLVAHWITGVTLQISFSHICYFLFLSRVIMGKAFARMQTQRSVWEMVQLVAPWATAKFGNRTKQIR